MSDETTIVEGPQLPSPGRFPKIRFSGRCSSRSRPWPGRHPTNRTWPGSQRRVVPVRRRRREAGFEVCVDVTVVDWLRARPERFEIVANLLSMRHKLRLRMTTTAPREEPTVASLVPVWPGANFAEREAYDMFGIAIRRASRPDPDSDAR